MRPLALAVAALLTVVPAFAQPVAPPKATPSAARAKPLPAPERVTSVEGITEYRLANGLRVLLFPDASKPSMTVNITYLVGSRQENYGETGMAHLLEHLLFKGTPSHPDPTKTLTSLGGRANGSTWFDRTNYFVSFPASEANLQTALGLEADRMVHSFISRKDLDSEMTVVRNEFESGENDPENVTLQRLQAVAFDWHNYGKDTIGAKSDIEHVDIPRLQAFYRQFYQPDNAVLLVAGRIDEAKTLALVNQLFGPIPRPKRTLQRTYTTEPTQDGERSVTVRRVGGTPLVAAGYHVPAASAPDAAALGLAVQILSNTPSGRLYRALVDTKLASAIFEQSVSTLEPSFVIFAANLPAGSKVDAPLEALLNTVEHSSTPPFTAAELDRAKTEAQKRFDLITRETSRLAIALSEAMAAGDWRLFYLNRDRREAATLADVQRAAEHYFKASNRTVGIYLPTDKPDRSDVPPAADVQAMVHDYQGRAPMAQGEAFDASPANIDARTTRFGAPNGLKGALLPKKTKGALVSVDLTLRFGTEAALSNLGEVPYLAGGMLLRGTASHTREQLKDTFDKLKAQVNVNGGAEGARVSITTVRENLPAVLTLVAEVLRRPSFPAKELELLVAESVTDLEEAKSEPQTVATIALNKYMSPYPAGSPREVKTPEESIRGLKAATLEQVQAFHKSFYGADHATFAAVGDFDAQEVQALVTRLFGDWKSEQPYLRIPERMKLVKPLEEQLQTPDKANAFFYSMYPIALQDTDSDYAAFALSNWLLGGGFLNSRLADRVRKTDGLSYGVGAGFYASSREPVGRWVGYAIYNPANVGKLEAAFRTVLAQTSAGGFRKAELEEGRSAWLQNRAVSRTQDAGLAAKLSGYLDLGRTMAFDAELEQRASALSAEQVTAVFRKYLDTEHISVVKAGDFTAKKPGS
ncbi:MAG: M16 family metallopeptidase [Myxococcaceae bacterium]